MNQDPPTIEEELRKLQAAPLDDALLARLDACADDTWTELTRDELRFENLLRQSIPARLSPGFLAELESVTRSVHFPVNGKILLFPKGAPAAKTRTHRPMWATAAAVAIIGAASALLMPTQEVPKAASVGSSQTSPPVSANAARNFVPASFNRGLSAVHDEGVIWKSNTEPQRVVRVVYMDHITLKDASGRTFEVEQPRVEYMLVPARTD
ncbi:MAG: hypothetical protein WEB53_06800 [Akkermansiaceae bacterium]